MTQPRDRVEQLLTHYLRTVWQQAGLTWDNDNTHEIQNLVDAIEHMAMDEIRGHLDSAPHICRDGSSC